MTRFRALAAVIAAMVAVAAAAAEGEGAPLDEAVSRMLSVRESPAAFERAAAAARKLGATDQAVLEARFLFHVDRNEDDRLADMLPDMLSRAARFRISDSEIFATEDDWLAVVEYVRALAALRDGDRDGFKRHITEAFWLSPGQGAAFAPHIERLRLEDAMKSVRVDADLPLRDLTGRETTISSLAGKSKATLLHFFSPWSRECEENIGDLRAVTAELAKHGIPVIGIVGEGDDSAVADTSEMLAALETPAPGAWLVDHPEQPLARLLRIRSAPTMVLVDAGGRVRFNGHPSEPRLWQELAAIAPDCRRPASDP